MNKVALLAQIYLRKIERWMVKEQEQKKERKRERERERERDKALVSYSRVIFFRIRKLQLTA